MRLLDDRPEGPAVFSPAIWARASAEQYVVVSCFLPKCFRCAVLDGCGTDVIYPRPNGEFAAGSISYSSFRLLLHDLLRDCSLVMGTDGDARTDPAERLPVREVIGPLGAMPDGLSKRQ